MFIFIPTLFFFYRNSQCNASYLMHVMLKYVQPSIH